MTPTMGQTLWQRLTESPHDDEVWTRFRDRYEKLLYRFLLGRTCDPQVAEELTVNVFTDVFCAIANPDRDPLHLHGGSFRPYLRAAASRAFSKLKAARMKSGTNRLDPDQTEWVDDLERRVAEHEQAEIEVERWAGIYRDAVGDLRREPQFSAASFDDFLTIYSPRQARAAHTRASGRHLDREIGRSQGTSGKNARRVLDRLIRAMLVRARDSLGTLPDPDTTLDPGARTVLRQRILVILEEVWTKYGHMSE